MLQQNSSFFLFLSSQVFNRRFYLIISFYFHFYQYMSGYSSISVHLLESLYFLQRGCLVLTHAFAEHLPQLLFTLESLINELLQILRNHVGRILLVKLNLSHLVLSNGL